MASLAVKYRPNSWEEVTEQSATVSILKNICKSEVLENKNFLFVGSAGCGKTTSARILANMLNDNKGAPIEIDAASNSGVDAMRSLVEEARSYPIGQKYKVFIIDEVHAISKAGWQVLLKTLEDGAGNSVFVLCTTEIDKIPETIMSRVQKFPFSKLSLSGIQQRMKHVLDSEIASGRNIQYEEDAVNYIAKLANGGMRDSLTLLDKVLAYSNCITMEVVISALNLPSYDEYFLLLGSIAKKDNAKISEIIDCVYNSGVNFVQWFERFHSFVMNIVKYTLLRDIDKTSIPSLYQEKLSKYTESHTVICLKLGNKLLDMINDLKGTQYLEEVALTYLCVASKRREESK